MYDHVQSAKEVVRHLLHAAGLGGALQSVRRRRGLAVRHLAQASPREVFAEIYRTGAWLYETGQDTRSGSGSTDAATRSLVPRLAAVLERLDCRVLVDVGCGDFNWLHRVEGDFDYVGLDIVEDVIAANRRAYAADRRTFLVADATVDPVPAGDVVLCREVLFHLSFEDGFKTLRNVLASGARFLIATTDRRTWFNANVRTGDFRILNLRARPFGFPEPLTEIRDDAVSRYRTMGVWRAADLETTLKA